MKKIFLSLCSLIVAYIPLVGQQIDGAEYYWGKDPGMGNGIAIPITEGKEIDTEFTIATLDLEGGLHRLNIRTRQDGLWSAYSTKVIFIGPVRESSDIVALAYAINQEPAPGEGTVVEIEAGTEIDLQIPLATAQFVPGDYEIWVSVKDSKGNWSDPVMQSLKVLDCDFDMPDLEPLTKIAYNNLPVNLGLQTTYSTPQSGQLDFEMSRQPARGVLAASTGGDFNYTAGEGAIGLDSAFFEVCNMCGICEDLKVYFIISEAPASSDLLIYNAISPNGDGNNEFMEIRNIENFPQNKLRIFNRWGNTVFEIENYDNSERRFEGRSKGSGTLLPPGTYYYELLLASTGEKKKGFLIIKY